MCVARKSVEEPFQVLMQQRVALDLVGELVQLFRGRQFPEYQQIADFDEVRLLGELLDRVAAIAQDARVAVDVGDGALGRGGVDEALVESGVAGLGQQRTKRDSVGPLRGADDVQLKLATWILEGGVLVFFCHGNPFVAERTDLCLSKGSPIVAIAPDRGTQTIRPAARRRQSGR